MADSSTHTIDDLYKGLKALAQSTFPKKCKSCGKEYPTVESFLKETESLKNHSGLKSTLDDDDQQIVELFRNCPCGSTLMDSFNDRRDFSEAGLKRRELFGKLLDMLEGKGLQPAQGRLELLKLMNGRKSDLLEKMGIKMQAG